MSCNKVLGCALVFVLLATATQVEADDMVPPDWRGGPGTITAEFDDWGAPGVGPGQVQLGFDQIESNPPLGYAPMQFAAEAHWNSSVVVLENYLGRESVLEVNPGGGMGPVGFGLVNYAIDNPLKKIRLQITFTGQGVMDFYVASGPPIPTLFPWPDEPLTKVDAVVAESYQHDDGWTTSAYDLEIRPNPAWETISLDWGYASPQFNASWIDQVVIDTQCVPEPGTIGLLLSGGLVAAAFWFRRRRA